MRHDSIFGRRYEQNSIRPSGENSLDLNHEEPKTEMLLLCFRRQYNLTRSWLFLDERFALSLCFMVVYVDFKRSLDMEKLYLNQPY